MYQNIQAQRFRIMLDILWTSFYHIVIILLAIGIAFSLPSAAIYVLYEWWPKVQTNANLLLATEIGLSAILIVLFNMLRIAWDGRHMFAAARLASLVYARDAGTSPLHRQARRLVKRSSAVRDVFVLTLTGFDTFAERNSPFNSMLATAYEIRVMLLNPSCQAAMRRADALSAQDVGLQSWRKEIAASIAYLSALHRSGKRVRLKFYEHEPVWKVVVLGDHVWVQHCHHGFEVKRQPEYVFALQNSAPRQGFFVPFYTYFLSHWNETHHPEYDFDTHELIYRDKAGNETKRAPLHGLDELPNPTSPPRRRAADLPQDTVSP